jgi:hypothetical protein
MLNQNISGFTPLIINVQPVSDVPMFLGLAGKEKKNS